MNVVIGALQPPISTYEKIQLLHNRIKIKHATRQTFSCLIWVDDHLHTKSCFDKFSNLGKIKI